MGSVAARTDHYAVALVRENVVCSCTIVKLELLYADKILHRETQCKAKSLLIFERCF